MTYFICLAAALIICTACEIYDDVMSEKGIKAGVAIEGFTWLIGTKPSLLAYYLRDSLVMILVTTPSFVADLLGSSPFAYAGLVAPLIYAVKHILGGRAWAKLLKK